jgi:TPR repeat protein
MNTNASATTHILEPSARTVGSATLTTPMAVLLAAPGAPARAETLDEVVAKAEARDLEAQFRLGAAHGEGPGAEKDPAKSAEWYLKAAERGLPEAQFAIGALHMLGDGVPKDPSKAAEWYLKAAEQGNALAQTNLGALYESGKGVDRDPAKAAEWYRKAAERGFTPGQ